MTNSIGLISMQVARPFVAEHFAWFDKIKVLGYDFIELLVPEEGELDLVQARRALEGSGLGVVLAARVSLERNIVSEDLVARKTGLEYLDYAIGVASELGASIVGGPLYGNPLVFAGRPPAPVPEAEREARIDRCVTALNQAGNLARDAGVTLAVEPLNRFETDFLSTTRQGITLIDLIAHSNVGLMLDTFHMHMEDASIPEAIRLAGKRIKHFQANENHRGFVGTGSTDWTEVARAICEVEYAGPISVEPFRRDDERIGVPLAQWRAPDEDESEKLSASLELLKSAISMGRYRR